MAPGALWTGSFSEKSSEGKFDDQLEYVVATRKPKYTAAHFQLNQSSTFCSNSCIAGCCIERVADD